MAFFKDRIQYLSEDSRSTINFSFGDSKEQLKDKITRMENGTLLGIMGPFGSGKSTALNQIRTELEDSNNKWVEVDTWQFPDRKELWEGMIYKMATDLGKTSIEVGNKIDGQDSQRKGFGKAIISAASLGSTDQFFKLLESPPMKRVHELQEFLKDIVKEYPKNIVIILEDVDRAGESGLFFIETVSLFFKQHFPDQNIKVLVPISNKSYNDNIDIYLKCFDYTFKFTPTYKDIGIFLENITTEGSNGKIGINCTATQVVPEIFVKSHLVGFLSELLNQGFTPRDIRTILRNADITHDSIIGKGVVFPDIRLLIAIETSKTVIGRGLLQINQSGHLSNSNSIGKLLIASSVTNTQWDHINGNHAFNYKFISGIIGDSHSSKGWIMNNELLIPDYYLGY